MSTSAFSVTAPTAAPVTIYAEQPDGTRQAICTLSAGGSLSWIGFSNAAGIEQQPVIIDPDIVREAVKDTIYSLLFHTLTLGGAPAQDARAAHISIDGRHIRGGGVKSITLECMQGSGSIATKPRYLGIWQQSENGNTWEKIAASQDEVLQENGNSKTWTFDPSSAVLAAGRSIRICMLDSPDALWQYSYVMGLRVSAAQEDDAVTGYTYNNISTPCTPSLSIELQDLSLLAAIPGGSSCKCDSEALRKHIEDSAAHVTAADKSNWNAIITHMTNSSVHVTATEKSKWNSLQSMSSADADYLKTLRNNITITNGAISLHTRDEKWNELDITFALPDAYPDLTEGHSEGKPYMYYSHYSPEEKHLFSSYELLPTLLKNNIS